MSFIKQVAGLKACRAQLGVRESFLGEGCSGVTGGSSTLAVFVLNYMLLFLVAQGLSVSLAAELEFVQIIIIVVVMMVMVVVITCLLNHYKLSARSFISRHSQGRRRDENLSSVSHALPSSLLRPALVAK